MAVTVIQHVLNRLKSLGISHVFGVPGDYAFPVNDAVCNDPELTWVGCTNELNASYAADGYARVKGFAAVSTTFGVGELSAINGIAGGFAEHVPIFHLVGMPATEMQAARRAVHHTFGTGEFEFFHRMTKPVVCASAVMTPQNVASETERLIAAALYHRKPVYMAFPSDVAEAQVLSSAESIPAPRSDAASLTAAVDAIVAALGSAKTACVLPGIVIKRTGLAASAQKLIEASGLPFATMFMDKSVLDEAQPAYIGMYDGALMDEDVRAFVESADRILSICAIASDFNTGAFTSNVDPKRVIKIQHHAVHIDGRTFANIELADVLAALTERLPHRDWPRITLAARPVITGSGNDPIDADALYSRWEAFLKPNDILVAETGTSSMGLGFATLPKGASFHNQTLWGSIGWATPAAVGAAAAAPDSRVVLVTGDGSHQLTAQEIGQFGRLKLKPVVFLLNNNGYLIERLLCKDPAIYYNDVAPWRYSELPHALGIDGWYTARVATCGEFDAALEAASKAEGGVYIEIVTDTYVASPLSQKLHDSIETLYAA